MIEVVNRQRKISVDCERWQAFVIMAMRVLPTDAAGVTIAFGTDAGSPAVGHDVIAPEMKFMVKVGVMRDNYAALRSATSTAARLNKLDKQLGTLQVGKLADLLVVAGNPVAELDALNQVQMTFLAGKRMV